jgi:hypothetical protein
LGRSRATLDDGVSVTLTCDIDFIEPALLPVVVAVPGYVHLRYYDDAEEGEHDIRETVERMPIVAWRIADDIVFPVTPDEDEASSNLIGEGVLLPDGRVVQPFMELFDNEETWRAQMERQAEIQRKVEAERKSKLKLVEPTPARE